MFKQQIELVIFIIKMIRMYAQKMGHLNEQWFLDFMDELNELSIDPEPNDTN